MQRDVQGQSQMQFLIGLDVPIRLQKSLFSVENSSILELLKEISLLF